MQNIPTPNQHLDQTLGRTNVRGDRLRPRVHSDHSASSSRRSSAPAWWIVLLAALACGAAPLSARPVNDNFANAQVVASMSSFGVSGRIVGATREVGEPSSNDQGTMWFRWVAPVTGVATFESTGRTDIGASIAPYIRIGQGASVVNLPVAGISYNPTEMNGWFPVTNTGLMRLLIPVRAGEVYQIQLQGAVSGTQRVALNLRGITPINGPEFGVTFGPAEYYYVRPRSNDNFAAAADIAVRNPTTGGLVYPSRFSATASTVGATREVGEPSSSDQGTVWFRWVAPRTGVATFESAGRIDAGSSVAPYIRIGQGASVVNLPVAGVSQNPTEINGWFPVTNSGLMRLLIPVRAGQVYHIQLQGAVSGTQTVALNLRGITAINGPEFGVTFGEAEYYYVRPRSNDNFAAAADIAVRNPTTGALVYPSRFSATASTVGATREVGEPSSSDQGTVWFRWVAPRTGVATFEAAGRTDDNRQIAPCIRIGQRNSAGGFAQMGLAVTPDGVSGRMRLALAVRAGQAYHIQLQGAVSGTQTAALNLVSLR